MNWRFWKRKTRHKPPHSDLFMHIAKDDAFLDLIQAIIEYETQKIVSNKEEK